MCVCVCVCVCVGGGGGGGGGGLSNWSTCVVYQGMGVCLDWCTYDVYRSVGGRFIVTPVTHEVVWGPLYWHTCDTHSWG